LLSGAFVLALAFGSTVANGVTNGVKGATEVVALNGTVEFKELDAIGNGCVVADGIALTGVFACWFCWFGLTLLFCLFEVCGFVCGCGCGCGLGLVFTVGFEACVVVFLVVVGLGLAVVGSAFDVVADDFAVDVAGVFPSSSPSSSPSSALL